MSRLATTRIEPEVHFINIEDAESGAVQALPVFHVMREYDYVEADGSTRPFVLSDFFLESGEALPIVNVSLASKAGKLWREGKKKYQKGKEKVKKAAKKAAEKGADWVKKQRDEFNGPDSSAESNALPKLKY